jgi:hypothetical protein
MVLSFCTLSCSCTMTWWWRTFEVETCCQVINTRKRVSRVWLKISIYISNYFVHLTFRHLTVNYSWRTAPLTSKVAFYTFIQQIQVPNIWYIRNTLRGFADRNALCHGPTAVRGTQHYKHHVGHTVMNTNGINSAVIKVRWRIVRKRVRHSEKSNLSPRFLRVTG